MAPMSLIILLALFAHAVQSIRQTIEHGDQEHMFQVMNSSVVGMEPPDVSSDMPSIFLEHKDAFGQDSDAWTWSATLPVGSTTGKEKVILTSDLFSSGSTKPILTRLLKNMLNHRHGLKALWITDARSGWSVKDMTLVWLMDTFPEIGMFKKCGLDTNIGLWINRWDEENAPMTMTDDIRFPGVGYQEAGVDAVKTRIDEASVLYVPGGNPYTFMKQLRSASGRQIWAHALARIRSGDLIYISRSAGTIVAGSTIETSADAHPPDFNLDGLDLLPWKMAFRPHYHAIYVQQRIAHSTEWRDEHPSSKWGQDDFLAGLNENYPGVRGVHIHDGDILAFKDGRLSLMHGETKSEDVLDDITEMFFQQGKAVEEVQLGDDSYNCCCKKNAERNSMECELKRRRHNWGGIMRAMGCGLSKSSWHVTAQKFHGVENVGRCIVPSSSIPTSEGIVKQYRIRTA